MCAAIAKEIGFAADLELLDLANFASVKAFASRLKDSPIDILVANAGIAQLEYQATADGLDQTYVRS